jgi:23S rRNA pseudouridine1911/1915/1917 synthase
LAAGELIRLFRPLPVEPEVPREYSVLYEDEWLLAVDKPAGLPVHPTARYFRNTLTALLKERYGDQRPVLTHRLDSETSGVVLTAKTKAVESAVKKMFAARQVGKVYQAVVGGTPQPRSGRIDIPLGPDESSPVRVKMAGRADGLPALTEYTVEKEFPSRRISLVRCFPRTGRQHQIRAHLAHIGHPVVGDKMYGPDRNLFLEYVENGPTPEVIERAGFPRQALHATSLRLTHPVRGEEWEITSPLPPDIRSLVDLD